jgi:sugar lactone lactonase YvrE
MNEYWFAFIATLRTSINATIARLVLLVAGCLVATTVNAAVVQRANLDGSGVTELVTGASNIYGIALDVAGGQMYWTDINANMIQRANLDGSGVTNLVTGLTFPRAIALDVAGGQMYWTETSPYPSSSIQRANLDGSGVTELVTGLSFPQGIALHSQTRFSGQTSMARGGRSW